MREQVASWATAPHPGSEVEEPEEDNDVRHHGQRVTSNRNAEITMCQGVRRTQSATTGAEGARSASHGQVG